MGTDGSALFSSKAHATLHAEEPVFRRRSSTVARLCYLIASFLGRDLLILGFDSIFFFQKYVDPEGRSLPSAPTTFRYKTAPTTASLRDFCKASLLVVDGFTAMCRTEKHLIREAEKSPSPS